MANRIFMSAVFVKSFLNGLVKSHAINANTIKRLTKNLKGRKKATSASKATKAFCKGLYVSGKISCSLNIP